MGLFSSLTKGLSKGLSKAFGSGVAGSLTGGVSSLFTGGVDSASDILDPGNIFHKGAAEREAERQWQLEYNLSKQNYESQQYWNDLNYKAQQEAFQYQKDLNALQMEREDNAVQRRVADLKAAGLSPTLAAGSAASATPVRAGSAPQGVAPQQASPSDIKAQYQMFKAQQQKDYMQLFMTMASNYADISRTKAETELINAQKGHQDIINKYEDAMMQKKVEQIELNNIAQNMANSFNQLANPARLIEMRTNIDKLKKELKILDFDEKIKTNESLRQIYYNQRAKFEAAIAGHNVDIARLRAENIDYDTALKAYSLTYAYKHGVPLSGLNQWHVLEQVGAMLGRIFGFNWEDWQAYGMNGPQKPF